LKFKRVVGTVLGQNNGLKVLERYGQQLSRVPHPRTVCGLLLVGGIIKIVSWEMTYPFLVVATFSVHERTYWVVEQKSFWVLQFGYLR